MLWMRVFYPDSDSLKQGLDQYKPEDYWKLLSFRHTVEVKIHVQSLQGGEVEDLCIVFIFNWIPRCSQSIWSTPNSHSRSRCWIPAVLMYKKSDTSKLHRPVPRFHSPSAHPLLSFSLLSPSQTILVSLLLLFCHCFLGEKKNPRHISAIQ